jgi:hypothetical protein
LAKCYSADSKFPGKDFFQDKLKQLEKEMAREKLSLWTLIESGDDAEEKDQAEIC